MTNPTVNALIEYWRAHDVRYLPGVSDDEIAAFETKHAAMLPDDVRSFYQATNGTQVPLSAGQDHESFDFYPLSEIAPDADFGWALTFADYRELSWWYSFDLTGAGGFGTGAVFILGTVAREPIIAALSFDEFLELYVRGDSRMMQYPAIAYHKSLLRNRSD